MRFNPCHPCKTVILARGVGSGEVGVTHGIWRWEAVSRTSRESLGFCQTATAVDVDVCACCVQHQGHLGRTRPHADVRAQVEGVRPRRVMYNYCRLDLTEDASSSRVQGDQCYLTLKVQFALHAASRHVAPSLYWVHFIPYDVTGVLYCTVRCDRPTRVPPLPLDAAAWQPALCSKSWRQVGLPVP
jgi:hypothetical protein